MASLFRQGLIYGFVKAPDTEAEPPSNSKTHILLDFSREGAETAYRAAYRERLQNKNGAVPRAHIEANREPLQHPWWVEFKAMDYAGKPFHVALLGRVDFGASGTRVQSSLWTDLPDGRIASSINSWFDLDFSDDGFLCVEPANHHISTALAHKPDEVDTWHHYEDINSCFLTTLDAMLAVCAFNQGWFQTERAGSNRFSFSESRKAKVASGYIERKKALMAMDVREVKAFLDTPPVPEWREFDPLAERAARGPHCGYREHEVRPFTRHYKKSGKIVQVRGFKRGNPALGSLIRMTSVQP